MNNENIQSLIEIIAAVSLVFMTFYLVVMFPAYFAGFFFGLFFYAVIDAYIKKDL